MTSRSANLDDSKEKGVDLLILKAIKKMKRLDQILANKQSQERAVKKQGRELRAKLWEEFQVRNTRSIPEYFYEPSFIYDDEWLCLFTFELLFGI